MGKPVRVRVSLLAPSFIHVSVTEMTKEISERTAWILSFVVLAWDVVIVAGFLLLPITMIVMKFQLNEGVIIASLVSIIMLCIAGIVHVRIREDFREYLSKQYKPSADDFLVGSLYLMTVCSILSFVFWLASSAILSSIH